MEKARALISVKSIGALTALFLLIALSSLFWMEMNKRFPVVSPGVYMGHLHLSSEENPLYFFVERLEGSSSFSLTLLEDQAQPYVAQIPEGNSEEPGPVRPVVIEGEKYSYRLIGSQVSPELFSGTVKNLESGEEGQWKLRRIQLINKKKNSLANLELRQKLVLIDEVQSLDKRLEFMKERVAAQRAEINELSDVITEGESLKRDGQSQFELVRQEKDQVQTILQRKRAEAKELVKKLEIAQRLTKGGKLVSLARQLSERENRWIDSMLRTQVTNYTPEVQQAIDRGMKILELKRRIRDEKQKIQRLQEMNSYGSDFSGSIPFEGQY